MQLDKTTQRVLILGAAATGVVLLIGWQARKRMRERSFKVVGSVTGLFNYPVKSCRAISRKTARCTPMGVELDRNWVILDREDRFISQRSHPSLARISVSVDDDDQLLTLSTVGRDDLVLPILTGEEENLTRKTITIFSVAGEGVHVDEKADCWISEFLGKEGFRIFQFVPSCKPRFVSSDKKFGSDAKPHDTAAFSDLCPYLLISEPSLAALNEHLGDRVTMTRFRPNIVIDGCSAYDEDKWKTIRIGDVEFRCLHPCGRCILPTVDPETGIMDSDKEPLATLRKIRLVPKSKDPRYGQSPIFGRNLACDRTGVIHVGDSVIASTMA